MPLILGLGHRRVFDDLTRSPCVMKILHRLNLTRRSTPTQQLLHIAYRHLQHSSSMSVNIKRKAADLAEAATKKPKVNSSITSFFGAPKVTEPKAPAPAIKFDKEKWVQQLTEEHKDLLKLEIDTLHESWLGHLKDDLTSKSFLDLKRFLKSEKESGNTVFPPSEDVYSWYALYSLQIKLD